MLPDIAAKHLSANAIKNINDWFTLPKYAEYKDQLVRMIADEQWQELEDSFFKVIEFGTGGRRGTTGIGSNRINRITIGESAQALCEYALKNNPMAAESGVVIAYDTRLSSKELSRYTAQVCAAAGFKTYLFDDFRSTPELSFAVRKLSAAIGIVISASHNPPMDNGFKGYWADGGQLVAPHDVGVLETAQSISDIKTIDFDEAVDDQKIIIIGNDIDDEYIHSVVAQSEGDIRNVSIVYSPLHGAGQTNVLPVLQQAGFATIAPVKEQMTPDGNFSTIKNGKPNPEERIANDMAVTKMLKESADIAITNDPDADRIGVVVRQGNEAKYLTGNQSAVLAVNYCLMKRQESGKLRLTDYIAKTIVTTDLLNELAEYYGIRIYDNFLVGFKYIGGLILKKENTDETFLMGAEESYGLLKGEYTRDKDGAAGALVIAEYAAELKAQSKTLYDKLLEIFTLHGIFAERLDNVMSPGADGFDRMQKVMKGLRDNPPKALAGHAVTAILDYSTLQKRDLMIGTESKIDCIKGDVIVLEFGDKRRRITIRPSGTEPKLKFYVQWYEKPQSTDVHETEDQYMELERMIGVLSKELEGLLFSK